MPAAARFLVPVVLAALACAAPPARAVQVFSTDFESGLPAEFAAPGSVIEGVQGYAGLGPAGRPFGGQFLRYTSVPVMPTQLTVRNLPPHDLLSVRFLLAIIDSWDSTEIMEIRVDGSLRFSHRFSLAVADTTTYHPAPPGAILSMGSNLGFSAGQYYSRDRAYDLGADPAFLEIPHTADSVVVSWTLSAVSGPAADQWQGGSDESWAIDAVRIEVSSGTAGTGEGAKAGGLALAASPNPARAGVLHFRIALPAGGPAMLELVDLAGRRLATQDLRGRGAGAHAVELAPSGTLAPGIYFARLTQGAAVRTARVAVLE